MAALALCVAPLSQPAAAQTSYAYQSTIQVNSASTGLANPFGISRDPNNGDIFVTDQTTATVRRFKSDGSRLANLVPTGAVGFLNPRGVAVGLDTKVYVADTGNNRIVRFKADRSFDVAIGTKGTDATVGNNAQFTTPNGVAADAGGNIYVADTGNSRLVKTSTTGKITWVVAGGQFNAPTSVALDSSGKVYVADTGNSRIVKLNADGTSPTVIIPQAGSGVTLSTPTGVSVDPFGNIFVVEQNGARVRKFNKFGVLEATVNTTGATPAAIYQPFGVTVDSLGDFWFSDRTTTPGNGRVHQFNPVNAVPTLTTIAPTTVVSGTADTTITLTGTGLQANSVAQVNGTTVATNYLSTTSLEAVVPATMFPLGTLGTLNVTVVNPTPGGGTSAPQGLTVVNPVPTLGTVAPNSILENSGDTVITLTGTKFVPTSVVSLAGTPLATTYVSGTTVTAVVPAAALTTAGTTTVTVSNPAPGGGESVARGLTIANRVPTVTTLNPTVVSINNGDKTITVNGSDFVATSVVQVSGVNVATTYVSRTKLTAVVPDSLLTVAGTPVPVTVSNPAPAGGTSNSVNLNTQNPVPAIANFNPTALIVGSSDTTLTINGTSFAPGAVVTLSGTELVTTFVSKTQLTAVVPAAAMASTSTGLPVRVKNAAPGGGLSSIRNIAVNNPKPVLTTIAPTSVIVGSGDTTVTLTGSNFEPNSVAKSGATVLATTVVSDTELSVVIPASLLATTGNKSIFVATPTPGGGNSTTKSLVVVNPVPAISAVSPNSAVELSPATVITVTGSNFVATSRVKFNSSTLVTTFVDANTLTATIPSTLLTAPTTTPAKITVTTGTPGGGTSVDNVPFSVTMGTAVLDIVATPSVTKGGTSASPTLTIKFQLKNNSNYTGRSVKITAADLNGVSATVISPSTALNVTRLTGVVNVQLTFPYDVALKGTTPTVTLTYTATNGGATVSTTTAVVP